MRINRIEISWFRGAADSAELDTESKNVAIYGANGSGKSTFSDALEYMVKKGKIRHLRHEYSGTHQEKGVINTHAPDGATSLINIDFEGGISIGTIIAKDGVPSFASSPPDFIEFMQQWELEQLILRQDEVATFVIKQKGDKYSALLPLLGLEDLEEAANNLNKLSQHIKAEGRLTEKQATLGSLKQEASRWLPDFSDTTVSNFLEALSRSYIVGKIPTERDSLIATLRDSIEAKLETLQPEINRYTLSKQIYDEDVPRKLSEAMKTQAELRGKIDVLLDSRIEILERTSVFIDRLARDINEIDCPSCGRAIKVNEFTNHVSHELKSLQELRSIRDIAKSTLRNLTNSLDKVQRDFKQDIISSWLNEEEQKELRVPATQLLSIDLAIWHDEYPTEDIAVLDNILPQIITRIKSVLDKAAPSTKKLLDDKATVDAISNVDRITTLEKEIKRMNRIIGALASSEDAIRGYIRSRTQDIIGNISSDILNLWTKLHPGEPIEDIKLYIPGDADKAIDICLKFFGKNQPSPRLTLSEGHRNSLGLCIFLGLSRLDDSKKHPIFLDDIVSSWDREHRGMLARILMEDLSDRQVFLFTHDREWFHELRTVLPAKTWKFLVLKPWISPDIGLRWSQSQDTFDDARDLIKQNAEAAGNRVRAIMDTQLGIIAEKLKIRMPYARGDRNDCRTCIEFLETIISEAKTHLRKRVGDAWQEYLDPIDDLNNARKFLIAWGDRASHAGTITPSEVEQLIQICEKALDRFKCEGCRSFIWAADRVSQEKLQCTCGNMQWKYG